MNEVAKPPRITHKGVYYFRNYETAHEVAAEIYRQSCVNPFPRIVYHTIGWAISKQDEDGPYYGPEGFIVS